MQKTLYIRINNDNIIAVESSKHREKLAKISEKFNKIIKKCKKEEQKWK